VTLTADLLSVLLNGLQTGAIFVLVAMGLSIILGTLQFVNFAHGALYLIGAYLGLFITNEVTLSNGLLQQYGYETVGLGLGFLPALILVPLIVFAIGLAMERFVARPFYDRPDTDQILLTFGLAIVIQELFRVLFGGQSIDFARPSWASGPITLPIVGNFPKWRLYVIAITAVLVLLVVVLVEYTDFGLVVRAGTRDPEMVELLGIKLTRPYIVMFAIGAALAGIAGVVGAPLENVNPSIGMEVLVPAFLVVVIGGVGSIRGAVVGGILVGMVFAIFVSAPLPAIELGGSPIQWSRWGEVSIYALAAVVLLARPEGLFGDEGVA